MTASTGGTGTLTLFLCGDVMTGRGIDQILPYSNRPHLYEPYVRSADAYVRLAERAGGPVGPPVDFDYVWGHALDVLRRRAPHWRIINLETAVTTSEDAWPNKGIHYRMHPGNVRTLTAAGIDCCVLANNHVLDWGYRGLQETLRTLHRAGIATAGAGRDAAEAAAPAIVQTPGKGRVLVFAYGLRDSGIPPDWAAAAGKPGVSFLPDLSARSLETVVETIGATRRRGDLIVVSLHWGGNWGFHIPQAQRDFAQGLIERAGVDLIHGHSSHHVKGIGVHRDRAILYGCGDFLNDYEGIGGNEAYRGDLALMYFATLATDGGGLRRLAMVPTRTRRLQVQPAPPEGVEWLLDTLQREGHRLGTGARQGDEGTLLLEWSTKPSG